MTPIERTQVRAEALSVLGLRGATQFSEIKRAWRQLAFETHPDRTDGDKEAFMRAKAAFELLSATAERENTMQPCRSGDRIAPRRPARAAAAEALTTALSSEDQAECRALLADNEEPECTDHVVEAVERKGRHLVYVVASRVAAGRNRVALPAKLLASNRKYPPSIVHFDVADAAGCEVVISDETRIEMFPEARSVRIRFQPVPRYQ